MAAAPQSISFIPPTDPGSYAAAIQLQRRQAIADALLAQSQQPLGADIPQGLRVIPRLGWQGGLIKLGQALMANKLENDVTSQRAALAQQQMQQLGGQFYGQGGGQAPSPPASPYATAQGAMAQPGSGEQLGPTAAAASRIPQQVTPAPAAPAEAAPQGGPMTIPGMDPGVSMRLFMSSPEEYWKALAAARAPTTEQKNWSAQGVDPRQLAGGTVLAGQRAGMTDIEKLQDAARRAGPGSPEAAQLQEAISKANYLAPIDAKPGTPLIDPRTGKPTFFAPKTADGIGLNFDDPLHPSAYALPGYAGANAGIAGAEQGARQANTVFTGVQGPNGAPMAGFGGQMFGGAGGGGGSPAPRAPVAPGGAPGGMPPARPPVAPPAQPQRSGVVTGQTPTDAAIAKNGADVIATAPQQVQQSRGTITGLEQALNLVESGIKTGPGTGKSVNVLALLNNMHVPLMKGDVDGYQTMQKYLQNSLNGAAAGTSAGGSDARFESFMHGQPNAETMNGPALSSAIRYVLAQHDATVARGNFLSKAYQAAQAQGDPNAAQTAQTQWSSVYNPDYFRIGRLPPNEQLSAVNAMSKSQAQHFMQWRQAMGAFQ